MLGLRLQILGQYQGLLRNFWERSQSVSPLTMTYSSGAPGTGWMLVSGGGRGLCSVMTGAFSGRCLAGAGFSGCAGWACWSWAGGCACCSGAGCACWSAGGACCWPCCARAVAGTASAVASVPARAALRNRAIVFVRMLPPKGPAGAAARTPSPAPPDAPVPAASESLWLPAAGP